MPVAQPAPAGRGASQAYPRQVHSCVRPVTPAAPAPAPPCWCGGPPPAANTLRGRLRRLAGPAHLHRLVHIANILRLHVRVLLTAADQLGERGEQALYPDAAHVHKLPGHERCGERNASGASAARPCLRSACSVHTSAAPLPVFVTTEAARTTIAAPDRAHRRQARERLPAAQRCGRPMGPPDPCAAPQLTQPAQTCWQRAIKARAG